MKNDIHPTYNTAVKVACACGESFTTGSTTSDISIEVCSKCHPFYTGKQKIVDSAKRVDKFQDRVAKSAELAKTRKGKKAKQAARAEKQAAAEETTPEVKAKKIVKKPAAIVEVKETPSEEPTKSDE